MQNAFRIRDAEYNVELSCTATGYCLHLGDERIPVALKRGEDGRELLQVAGRTSGVATAVHGDAVYVHVDGQSHALRYLHPLDRLAAVTGGAAEDQILAPMPGTVISAAVAAGASVKTGETLMVIESMKMETTLIAPREGSVAELHVGEGETFDRDALLISMQPEDAA